MRPSQATTPSMAAGSGTSTPSAISVMPRLRLTSGPAIAMRNSAPAEGNIPAKRATPPNSHRVMPSICMPSRRATTAWPSSWSNSDTKNSSAAQKPIASYAPSDRPGFSSGKTAAASDHTIGATTVSQLQLMPTSTPATRPRVTFGASDRRRPHREWAGAALPAGSSRFRPDDEDLAPRAVGHPLAHAPK